MIYNSSEPKSVKRGDMFYIFKHPSYGSEIDPKSGRPAVVVSCDELNDSIGTVLIVYLTTKYHGEYESRSYVSSGKCSNSYAVAEQITTVDKSLIGDYIGKMSEDDIKALEKSMLYSLGISSCKCRTDSKPKENYRIYKTLYETLLKECLERGNE